ncbi:ABC transporter permease [Brachybacterium sp. AOP43-C2-M15]|uniref:ABC transporter permease n=1 Tax=Brachybacterium sp. AOP43-C2-M15 TaxID=3457661 RepID=UPI004033631E
MTASVLPSSLPALPRLTLTETRLFLRDPAAIVFGPLLAPVLMLILGFVPSFREPDPAFGGLRVVDLFAPILVGVAVASLALTVLPQLLASYRQQGILRRLRTTPMRPVVLLLAQLLMCTALAVVSSALVLGIARGLHGIPLPQNGPAYLVGLLFTCAAMMGLGLLIGAFSPSGPAASGFGMLAYFPLLFLGGLWLPREAMPEVLRTLSDLSPLGAGVASLQHAAVGGWPEPGHLAVMALWSVLTIAVASRFFRWD